MLETYIRKLLVESQEYKSLYRIEDNGPPLIIRINGTDPRSFDHVKELEKLFSSVTGMRDQYGGIAEEITSQVVAPALPEGGDWINLNPTGPAGLDLGTTADLPGADVGSSGWPKTANVNTSGDNTTIAITADNYSVKSSHVGSGNFSTGILPLVKLMGWCLHFDKGGQFPWIKVNNNQKSFEKLIIANLEKDGDEISMPFGLYYFQVTPYDEDNLEESDDRTGIVLEFTDNLPKDGIRDYYSSAIKNDNKKKAADTWKLLGIPRPGKHIRRGQYAGSIVNGSDYDGTSDDNPFDDDNSQTRDALLAASTGDSSKDQEKLKSGTARFFRCFVEALFRTFYLHYDAMEAANAAARFDTLCRTIARSPEYMDDYYNVLNPLITDVFPALMLPIKDNVIAFLKSDLFHRMFDVTSRTKSFKVVTPKKNSEGNYSLFVDIYRALPSDNTFKVIKRTRTVASEDGAPGEEGYLEAYWNESRLTSPISKKEDFAGITKVARIDLTGTIGVSDYLLLRGDYTDLLDDTTEKFYSSFTSIYSAGVSDLGDTSQNLDTEIQTPGTQASSPTTLHQSHKAATSVVGLPVDTIMTNLTSDEKDSLEEAFELEKEILKLIDIMDSMPMSTSTMYAQKVWALMQTLQISLQREVEITASASGEDTETEKIIEQIDDIDKLMESTGMGEIFQTIMPKSFKAWLIDKRKEDPNYEVPEQYVRKMKQLNKILYAKYPNYKVIMQSNAGIADYLFEQSVLTSRPKLTLTLEAYVKLLEKFIIFLIAMLYQSIAETLGVVNYSQNNMSTQTIDITPDNQNAMSNEPVPVENIRALSDSQVDDQVQFQLEGRKRMRYSLLNLLEEQMMAPMPALGGGSAPLDSRVIDDPFDLDLETQSLLGLTRADEVDIDEDSVDSDFDGVPNELDTDDDTPQIDTMIAERFMQDLLRNEKRVRNERSNFEVGESHATKLKKKYYGRY